MKKYDPVAFGAFVRRLRLAEGLLQRDITARSGLHRSTIRNVEHGNIDIVPADTIHRLAVGLGVQTSYLMAKAGYGDEAGRWANFTMGERQWIARALREQELRGALALDPPPPFMRRLLEELDTLETPTEDG